MKFLIILLALACTALASEDEDRKEWVNFKNAHGKLYNNPQEEKLRFSIFQENLREIEEHNKQHKSGETTYTQKVTYFADLTNEEFVSTLKRQNTDRPNVESKHIYEKPIGLTIPESIDWREQGAVSEVMNQGNCAASWIYSVTGTLEGFNFVKTKKLVTLSTQQLIDCVTEDGGCNGGNIETTLQYIKDHGIETENDYPEGGDFTCRYNASAVFLKIKDFVYIEANNEDKLLSAVGLFGPISVTLDATQLSLYQGGVFSSKDCSKDNVNHAALVVGYGTDEETGLSYWLIKNSWGKNWGEDGYFKLKQGDNECGIASNSVYPVLQ